jgi:hypothetical protein
MDEVFARRDSQPHDPGRDQRGDRWGRGFGDQPGRERDRLQARDGRRPARNSEPLEQRLDRWVSRGRELVDGVSGSRPGSRRAGPEGPGQGQGGLGSGGLNPARLGRWVEERLDWLLDDDGDDAWREPWQQTSAPPPRRFDPSERSWEGRPREGTPREARAREERSMDGRRPEERPLPAAPSAMAPSAKSASAVTQSAGLRSAEQGAPAWSGQPLPPQLDPPARSARSPLASGRRSLEAISRRPGPGAAVGPGPAAGSPPPTTTTSTRTSTAASAPIPPAAAEPAWPDDASFTLQRWQRPGRVTANTAPANTATTAPANTAPANTATSPAEPPIAPDPVPGRPLPRSSRRR